MNKMEIYIKHCERFDEYMPDGSCRNGLRMTLSGFLEALNFYDNNNQPEPAMPKIAEIIKTMKNKIESSLEEFHKENPDSLKRKEYHNIIKEAELLTCDELLKEFYSNFTQLNKGE